MPLKEIKLKWPASIPEDHISVEFIQGMLDRMAFGYHNYGHFRRQDHQPDFMKCLKLRLDKYKKTHNTEFLMDAANYLMGEFMMPGDSKAFFESTNKRESPGAILKSGKHIKGKEDL